MKFTEEKLEQAGPKLSSIIRICRIAVVNSDILLGKLGEIDKPRLLRIKQKLSCWIQNSSY